MGILEVAKINNIESHFNENTCKCSVGYIRGHGSDTQNNGCEYQ